jgi:hypothetical protein
MRMAESMMLLMIQSMGCISPRSPHLRDRRVKGCMSGRAMEYADAAAPALDRPGRIRPSCERRRATFRGSAPSPFIQQGLVLLRVILTRRAAGVLAATLFSLSAAAPVAADPIPACPLPFADPFTFDLVPTAAANGARGTVALRFGMSPFGVTVTGNGSHAYNAVIETSGLPTGGPLMVWATTPALDEVVRLGPLGEDGSIRAPIALNKFLIFVTAEESATVERWSGPILLRGMSPSGRMHTMAGHGPFQGEACGNFGFRPGIGTL